MHSVAFHFDSRAARAVGTALGFEVAFIEPRAPHDAPLPSGHFVFLGGAQGTEVEVSEMRGKRAEGQERGCGNQTACQISGGGVGENSHSAFLFLFSGHLVQEPLL